MGFGDNSCVVTDAGVVELIGEHDLSVADQRDAALATATTLGTGPLCVELTHATFIDSSILASVVRCARELVGDGRSVVLRVADGSPPAAVVEVVGLRTQPGIVVESVAPPV